MPARTVQVPYTAEQDEDGVWCARAELRLGVVAYGDGDTRQAAVDDLREALIALIETVGVPDEVTCRLPPDAARPLAADLCL